MSGQADQTPGHPNLGFAGVFDDGLDSFDPAEWSAPAKPRPKPALEAQAASRRLAEAMGFRSREPGAWKPEAEPKPAPPERAQRAVQHQGQAQNHQGLLRRRPWLGFQRAAGTRGDASGRGSRGAVQAPGLTTVHPAPATPRFLLGAASAILRAAS